MAKVPATLTRVYVDNYDLSGDLNSAGIDLTQETPDVTAFSDTGPRRIPANYDHSTDDNGFFVAPALNIDAIIDALRTSAADHYVLHALSNAITEGSVGYEDIAVMGKEARSAAVGGAVLLQFSSAGSGGRMRCTVLRSAAAVTTTGQGTGQNLGTSTLGQTFAAVFRVVDVSGAGSITLRVQESSDNAAGDPYADIAGITATFTAVGAQRLTTTAATETWKRVSVQAFSGFTSVTILVDVGIMPA